MAKSKIIKDLANGSIDTLTALKRAKVLLTDLGNEEVMLWINNEINGYLDTAILPDYRETEGVLFGSYIKSHVTFNNVSLPLGNMPNDIRKKLLSVQFRESVDALKQMAVDSNTHWGKSIPADLFPIIVKSNNDPFMFITSATVEFNFQYIRNILSVIENRLLDVLILLEKEFGNLDDLDIDISNKSKDELKSISDRIFVIIYNNNSVSIGDGNKIKDSTIASAINDTESNT